MAKNEKVKVETVKEEKFTVLMDFLDLEDESYKYSVGDTYPRDGLKPAEGRIKELKGSKNKIGKPLIK